MNDFTLFETLLWENGSYYLLDLHLDRLADSAKTFSFPFDPDQARNVLEETVSSLKKTQKNKVKLSLENNGSTDTQHSVLKDPPEIPVKITFSGTETDPDDIFYYHKTSRRDLYDNELEKYRKKGFFDVIFTNRKKQITEGCITNVLIKKGKEYFTPPVKAGLLNGVYRQFLLGNPSFPIEEKILYKKDLLSADQVFLVNSVRKILTATTLDI
jgi:para-aminobenzoate synthetase/4-amino-4-deoxychorismate lyase